MPWARLCALSAFALALGVDGCPVLALHSPCSRGCLPCAARAREHAERRARAGHPACSSSRAREAACLALRERASTLSHDLPPEAAPRARAGSPLRALGVRACPALAVHACPVLAQRSPCSRGCLPCACSSSRAREAACLALRERASTLSHDLVPPRGRSASSRGCLPCASRAREHAVSRPCPTRGRSSPRVRRPFRRLHEHCRASLLCSWEQLFVPG